MATTTGRSVGLVAAVDDRRLIGFKAHPRQRELLQAVGRSRLTVACCGRRFGKTRAAAAAALWNLLLVPELDGMVAPGERRYALSVANSQAQATIFVEHARSLVRDSPALRGLLVSEAAGELVFTGDRVLAAFPCSARSSRGYAASFVCLDEFAHHFDVEDGGHQAAGRVWAAVTPSVAQFGDLGRVVVISTPLGDSGLFADLYAKARGGEIDGAESFHAATSENPLIDPSYLQAQEVALGYDDFRREFGAEFTGGGAAFIDGDRIRECVCDWRECLPADASGWVLGFDPGFASDPAACAVVGRSRSDTETLVCGLTARWLPPKSRRRVRRSRDEDTSRIETVIASVAEVAARYRARVVTDAHLPGVVVSEFQKHGIHATVRAWSAETKTQAAQATRARILTRRIELPDDPQLIGELSRLRTKYRAGSAMVEFPRSGDSHCDVASALLAAVGEHDRHAPLSDDSASFAVGGDRWATGDDRLPTVGYGMQM